MYSIEYIKNPSIKLKLIFYMQLIISYQFTIFFYKLLNIKIWKKKS